LYSIKSLQQKKTGPWAGAFFFCNRNGVPVLSDWDAITHLLLLTENHRPVGRNESVFTHPSGIQTRVSAGHHQNTRTLPHYSTLPPRQRKREWITSNKERTLVLRHLCRKWKRQEGITQTKPFLAYHPLAKFSKRNTARKIDLRRRKTNKVNLRIRKKHWPKNLPERGYQLLGPTRHFVHLLQVSEVSLDTVAIPNPNTPRLHGSSLKKRFLPALYSHSVTQSNKTARKRAVTRGTSSCFFDYQNQAPDRIQSFLD
jgi:hypothetical protein